MYPKFYLGLPLSLSVWSLSRMLVTWECKTGLQQDSETFMIKMFEEKSWIIEVQKKETITYITIKLQERDSVYQRWDLWGANMQEAKDTLQLTSSGFDNEFFQSFCYNQVW